MSYIVSRSLRIRMVYIALYARLKLLIIELCYYKKYKIGVELPKAEINSSHVQRIVILKA